MRFDGDWSQDVIGAAVEVHRRLGPGLLESLYEEALTWELSARSIPFERQKEVVVTYRGQPLGTRLRLDLLVGGSLVVEVKSVATVLPVHKAQLKTYLRLTGLTVGLLLNFDDVLLRDGMHRVVLHHPR